MSIVVRIRVLLVMIAVAVFLLSVSLEGDSVFGQQPETPLVPPTPTPFGFQPPPPSPAVSPTRDLRVVNEIVQPKSGDAIAGFTPIVGTALTTDYLKYDMHISPAGAENWRWLKTSSAIVRNGALHILNSYELSDGYYDLRVRAIDRKGNYNEAFVRRLEVRNSNPPTPTPIVDELGVVQPDSPLMPGLILTPTPTSTPLYRSYIPNGQGIFKPANGEIVSGQAPVIATVNSKTAFNPFDHYEVHIATPGSDEWNWLFTGDEQMWQSSVYTLDTTQLPDGFYDLRLRVVYRDSNYDEYYVSRLRFANGGTGNSSTSADVSTSGTVPGLYFPLAGTAISGLVDFVGTTSVADLLRWELYWSPAQREDWQFLVSDNRPVADDTIARLDLRLLPPGSYDFRLRIVRQDLRHSDYDIRGVSIVQPTPTPLPRLDQ